MAREHTRRVSQKLNYVSTHIELAGNASFEAELDGLLESAVFHLKGAYSAFLAELCSDAHMPTLASVTNFDSATQVSQHCDGFVPAPLVQCTELERSGWLGDLLAAYQQGLSVKAAMAAPKNSRNIIAVAKSSKSAKLTLEDCQGWNQKMNTLIDDLRESLIEC